MYTSRIVGVGSRNGMIVSSFTLASKSIPFRELRVNPDKKRINVFPRRGYESHSTNQDPEVDCYSCIRTGVLPSGSIYTISFNGHMCKRVEANMLDGLNPLMALDETLLEFRGAKNDARIGAVGVLTVEGIINVYLGTHDTDRGEKRVCLYPNNRFKDISDKLIYIYDKNTNFESVFSLANAPDDENELARYIHQNIVGEEITFGVATGVVISSPNSFKLGGYNHPIDESIIAKWKADLI